MWPKLWVYRPYLRKQDFVSHKCPILAANVFFCRVYSKMGLLDE